MTKPTGRPKGAPRKYESADEKPITLSLRVPRALVQPLKRYAAQHRQSMSELLLDGLRWRLSEGDPRGNGIALPPAGVETEKTYYENTEEGNMLVREVRELRTLLTEAVASGALTAPLPHSRNTVIHESTVVAVEPSEPVTPAPPPTARYGALGATVRAALAQQAQPVTCKTLAHALGLDTKEGDKAVHQVLDRLAKQGQVVKTGTQRTAVYALARPA